MKDEITLKEQTLRIGQDVVRRKLASLEQVRECVATQDELRRSGRDVPMGSLLVTRGIIGIEDLKEVLSGLGFLVLFCPACDHDVRVRDYDRHNRYVCNRCAGELIFSSNRPERRDEMPSPAPSGGTPQGEDPLIGRTVGGCRIRRRIARGGMGTVYEAEQINLNRTVALKVLARELAEDDSFVRRFLQEARAAAELNHTNIIHINDAGQSDGIFYYTMEFIEGENLNERLRRTGRLPVDLCIDVTEQVAAALQHAHSRGIVHRDIKPENIMIDEAGVVKLADLGLAKRTLEQSGSTLTQAGSILGTPYYMAPEQARDFRQADARSDLYSLGVTLYKMLTGRVPFDGSSPIEVMMKALEGQKIPVSRVCSDIPEEVTALVDRMMHVDPARRFRDAGVCRNALSSLRKHLARSV